MNRVPGPNTQRNNKMNNKITLDKAFLKDDIISPLANLYGEIESTGKVADTEELEVILVKLNNSLKAAN